MFEHAASYLALVRAFLAFFCSLATGNAHADTELSEAEVRQLWQLLDYVAVDYAGAVQNGTIVSELEYQEMQEFSTRAHSRVLALPPHPLREDHVTSAGKLRELTGAQAAVPGGCGIAPAEVQLNDSDVIRFGDNEQIKVLHTPGHTAGSMSYAWRGNIFTGDTLLIDGCGRTDFQSGSSDALYDSVTGKLFALPDETRMWPGHDYKGQAVSMIGWEKRHNARLAGRSQEDFAKLMSELNLPKPKLIDVAVPANQSLGLPHGS